MKLAEALILRADYQKRIEQLRHRLVKSAKVQEGDTPPEDPHVLLAELNTAVTELASLITRINKTNSQTILEGDVTISDALAQRDTLLLKRSVYSSLIESASIEQHRYGLAEIKYLSTINIAQMQQQMDSLSREYRELDTKIQQVNWNAELVE